MKRFFLLILLMQFLFVTAFAQCKTYKIGVKGDTLNCTDMQNKKQGKWVLHVESLRGEPGYEEEGIFKDDKKDGVWRRYSLQGDILAIENYRWGNKDGKCSYYDLTGLIREESWKAIDPKNPYDTIKVYDLKEPDKYSWQVVKVEASSVKQGTWNYYDPQIGAINKTEEYVLDQLVSPLNFKPLATASVTVVSDSTKAPVKKPAEVLQYEKKNSKKKKIQVRDGETGVQ
ncbi:MAG: toxin-antitoxin system YwqK family antitoxin [Chitinophagaceae bacterium]